MGQGFDFESFGWNRKHWKVQNERNSLDPHLPLLLKASFFKK